MQVKMRTAASRLQAMPTSAATCSTRSSCRAQYSLVCGGSRWDAQCLRAMTLAHPCRLCNNIDYCNMCSSAHEVMNTSLFFSDYGC